MSKTLFKQTITNDVTYEGITKDPTTDDYSKHYTKRKFLFGYKFYEHDFKETIHTKDSNNKQPVVGFSNGRDK